MLADPNFQRLYGTTTKFANRYLVPVNSEGTTTYEIRTRTGPKAFGNNFTYDKTNSIFGMGYLSVYLELNNYDIDLLIVVATNRFGNG